ncbi:endonuclease/exonuclease/phosphatase family protein [Nocardioides stalactiti]|uniref:endonuclease/exonuclease/phosphatase family protein n=1 Tax=Nocardioides stalactiti TaxID=2755356 RepID=UPI001601240E|nr:endonuclease/exonuclease/phosphatase family protein [Nocardioides stalactiti]
MRNHRHPSLARFGVPLLIGALALGLSSTARAGAAADPTDPTPAPVASVVKIASFNTAALSSTRQAFRDVKALLAEGPDIVALQEMSSWERRERVRTRLLDCETCLWDGWIPVPAVPGGQPILWRSDKFTFLGRDWIEVAPETYVGDRGAGPSTMHAKYVVRLRLRDNLTGRTIWILNNHFVPTVQDSDGGRNENRRRTRLYGQQMAGLLGVVDKIRAEEGGGLVFITGDFNVNYRNDKVAQDPIFPYAALGTRAYRASYYKLGEPATGTHELDNGFDKRLIDYVHFKPTRRVIAMSQRIVTGMASDHRPVIAEFKVTGKGCWVRGELVC